MGHSRGGDAVTSFIDWNRERPAPGRRYPLRGVISLAPVDYERRAPYGMPYLTILPLLRRRRLQPPGRALLRAQPVHRAGRPVPAHPDVAPRRQPQLVQHGLVRPTATTPAATDAACAVSQPNNIRLSGGAYTRETRGSGDPALMGDQEKAGLAMMGAFFRRYVGGDVAFDPYMTGEVSADGDHAAAARPRPARRRASGTRIPCFDRLMTSYFPAPAERRDVLRPETDNPLDGQRARHRDHRVGLLEPVPGRRRHQPAPADDRRAASTGATRSRRTSRPRLVGVPGPADGDEGLPAAGGDRARRPERRPREAPVNHSYGLQLALAWDQPASIARGSRRPRAT